MSSREEKSKMSKIHSRPGRTGFTLPEVVVAAFLLTITGVGIYALSSSFVRMNAFAADMASALGVGEAKVEEIHGMAYSNVVAGADTVDDYTRAWTVNTGVQPGVKMVVVTVAWTNLHNKAQEVKARTMVTDVEGPS
jgi:Tfp pilus assembly protein PilV